MYNVIQFNFTSDRYPFITNNTYKIRKMYSRGRLDSIIIFFFPCFCGMSCTLFFLKARKKMKLRFSYSFSYFQCRMVAEKNQIKQSFHVSWHSICYVYVLYHSSEFIYPLWRQKNDNDSQNMSEVTVESKA